MCGEPAWALRWSRLSHFSSTRNVSEPNLVWNEPTPSASVAGPYSMQPASACTAGTLARNASRIASRLPGLAVMMATTWIIVSLLIGSRHAGLDRGTRAPGLGHVNARRRHDAP